MTWSLGVQRIALLVLRPEHAPSLTNLCWNTADLAVLLTDGQVLVDLARTSAVLGIALVRVLPVERQIVRTSALWSRGHWVVAKLLGLWTWSSAEYLVTVLSWRPVDQLPRGRTAWVCGGIGPGGSDHETIDQRLGQNQNGKKKMMT